MPQLPRKLREGCGTSGRIIKIAETRVRTNMIPAGYMAKYVMSRPEWLKAESVIDIYSISGCISDYFADYIKYWKHNGYWFFDSPEIIRQLAIEHSLDLTKTSLFYYEVYEFEFDEDEARWIPFEPTDFTTQVIEPKSKHLEGYDVITFSLGTNPECSPLSCNALAAEVETNEHCLLPSLEETQRILKGGRFNKTEPGPFRIFAVYSVQWP